MLASLALGAIATWASEVMFWSAPPADLTAATLALTWLAYALACACALSAVAWTGLGGLRGLFLGGAIMGWLVEGVVVGTMYDAFPVQLVWTPLAWHALLTGAVATGRVLAAPRWSLAAQVLAMAGIGVLAGLWSGYWPLERDDLPGWGPTLAYLGGCGGAVPIAAACLGRIGAVPRPGRAVLLAAPSVALLAWIAGTAVAPSPLRLACPVLVGLTVRAMRRLRRGGPAPAFPASAEWRHAVFLLAPASATVLAVPLWRMGGLAVNWAYLAILSTGALGWWALLMAQAARRRGV